jgi:amino acid transporter
VFTRDATGLVKNVTFFDSIALNLGNMSIGAGLGVIGLSTILLPAAIVSGGFNLVLTSIIAFLISIPQIIVYTMMTRRLPRTGGDYVWVSRTFGGFIGSSFSFMGYTLETLAYLALIAVSAVFAIGGVMVGLGQFNFLGLSVPGNALGAVGITGGAATTALAEQFAVGAVIFAVLIGVNIFAPKAGYKLVSVLITIGTISLVVAIITLLAYGSKAPGNYINFANSNFAAGTNVTAVSSSTPSTASAYNFSGIVYLIPFFAIFVYPWLNAAAATSSEIKSKGAIRWNVPIAAVISFTLITAAFGAMYYAGGFSFVSGALTGPLSAYSDFNFWTFAMGATPITALQAFIGLGWIIWNVGVLAYGVIVFSRYLFAQSFDRFLPEKLSYVSSRYSSPVIAHVVDLVITVILIGLASFLYGTLVDLYGTVIAAMVYFFVVGLAAAGYGLKREKGTARATLVIAGILTAAVFAFLTYQFLAPYFANLANSSYPNTWGGNYVAFAYVIGAWVAGALIFVASRAYHKSKGVDITLAYKEIPPE